MNVRGGDLNFEPFKVVHMTNLKQFAILFHTDMVHTVLYFVPKNLLLLGLTDGIVQEPKFVAKTDVPFMLELLYNASRANFRLTVFTIVLPFFNLWAA